MREGRILDPEKLFFDEQGYADKRVDCGGSIIAPGFIDVQINGTHTPTDTHLCMCFRSCAAAVTLIPGQTTCWNKDDRTAQLQTLLNVQSLELKVVSVASELTLQFFRVIESIVAAEGAGLVYPEGSNGSSSCCRRLRHRLLAGV